MAPNWKALAPHKPLGPGDPQYIPRPDGKAAHVARLIDADLGPVLLAGAAGIGKSTELAAIALALQDRFITCHVPLDRYDNMKTVTPETVAWRIIGRVVQIAEEFLKIQLSSELLHRLQPASRPREQLLSADFNAAWWGPPGDVTLALFREVRQKSRQGRIVLLIDGLEKTEPEGAALIFDLLSTWLDEVSMVAVAPWHAAYGPGAAGILGGRGKLVAIPALMVSYPDREADFPNICFLAEVCCRRLGIVLPVEQFPRQRRLGDVNFRLDSLISAVVASGGVPRTFLQLMADAAAYGRFEGRDWPLLDDLKRAASEHQESLRRLLEPGDDQILRAANGTDGRQIELARKIRLLAQGLLLEYVEAAGPVLRPAPMVFPLLPP